MTELTNNEKNPIIARRVGVKPVNKRVLTGGLYRFYVRKKVYPDFFTPEGQVVLAGALTGKDNIELSIKFANWVKRKYLYVPGDLQTDPNFFWLGIIAEKETKLAELFWEFIQSESEAN